MIRAKDWSANCKWLTIVSISANFPAMGYSIEYFHTRVKEEIEAWPVGILADLARMVELLMQFGPALRMPHSRALEAAFLN